MWLVQPYFCFCFRRKWFGQNETRQNMSQGFLCFCFLFWIRIETALTFTRHKSSKYEVACPPLRMVNLNEPLENKINEIWGLKHEDQFSTFFLDLVQNSCSVRFPYLFRFNSLIEASRDMRKFPQKCQKIAGCWECSSSAYFHFVTVFLSERHDKVLEAKELGRGCVRPWLIRDIVQTTSFRKGWAKSRFRGDQRSETIGGALSTPGYLLTFAVSAGPYIIYRADPWSRNEKQTWTCVWYQFKKRNWSSRLVTHKCMMTIPTPPVKSTPWYVAIPDCCACFAEHITRHPVCTCCACFAKHMMMTYQQFRRIRYVMRAV